jgi:CheY-like chemotaxis protein
MRHHEEGTGLGLAISRQLAVLMGTRVQARSKLGEGSEFFFELLLPVVEAPRVMPAHSRRGYAGPRKKLLLVDDVEDNRAVLRHLLAPLGFELIEAVDGDDCLDKVASARPDLVVMDLVMPGMNGLDVLRTLRRTVPAEALPVMVVSASASDGDAMASLEAGANVFLAKPIVAESLIEELGTLLALEWVHDAPSP